MFPTAHSPIRFTQSVSYIFISDTDTHAYTYVFIISVIGFSEFLHTRWVVDISNIYICLCVLKSYLTMLGTNELKS